MRAALYLRISQDRLGLELGVERQREDCAALARSRGWDDFTVYQDNDLSATSGKVRPEYRRLMAAVEAGEVDRVIVWHQGRFWRNRRERAEGIEILRKARVTLVAVRGPELDMASASGRALAGLLGEFDTWETDEKSERSEREARQRAEQGRHHGGPRAYGITADGAALVPDEADRIRTWYTAMLAGGSISGIRKQLNADGVLTPTWTTRRGRTMGGRPWHDSSIRVILLNERNGGLRIHNGVEYPAPNPPIVSADVFRAVRDLLQDPDRKTNHDGAARKWLGAGLYECERCGGKRVRTSYDGTRANRWRVYVCGQRDGGCGRSWKAEPIDKWINDLVEGILTTEDARGRLLLARDGHDIDLAGEMRAERQTIKSNMKVLATEFVTAKGATRDALRSGLKVAEDRLAELDAALSYLGKQGALEEILGAEDPIAAWRALADVGTRQTIIQALMTITLGAPIRGRAKWDARRFITVEPRST